MNYLEDLSKIIEDVEYGDVMVTVKRHTKKTHQIIIHAFESHKPSDNANAAAIIMQVIKEATNANYTGNAMEAAPKTIGNTRLTWQPNARNQAQIEWVYLGSYWLEASNSPTYGKYEGHQVFHLRWSHSLSDSIRLHARIMNLTDKRYADSASVSSSTPVFSPALPRALYVGADVRW